MIKRKQRVNIGSSIESVYTNTPELLFPSLYDLENDIPKDLSICSQRYAELNSQKKFARKFWNRFQVADNIIIIDGFAKEISTKIINSNMKKNAKLVIYTSCTKSEAKKILSEINHSNTFFYKLEDIVVIHDRYAILDDELFHFGSTVGGFTKHFTTYSRGWDKNKLSGLLEFLERNRNNRKYMEEITLYDR